MPESTLDLWASDLVGTEVVTPVSILRQQAALLGPKTSNLVVGDVVTNVSAPDPGFIHTFYVVAPALSNYRYQLFYISHGVHLYPVIGMFQEKKETLHSEEHLLMWLRGVLSSDETKRVVSALLAQSR